MRILLVGIVRVRDDSCNNAMARNAVYANRRRIRGARGRALLRRRSEYLDRPNAHLYETGGMRRTHLRGHANILKRLVKTLGRPRWKKAPGYHRQGRVENAFLRYKSIIGEDLRVRSPAGQGSEVVLGCEILNRMTAVGRPMSYRIGRGGSCRWGLVPERSTRCSRS